MDLTGLDLEHLPLPELGLGASLVCLAAAASWYLWRSMAPAVARGEQWLGESSTVELAKRIDPHGVSKEVSLAEAELEQTGSPAALERALRKLLAENRVGPLVTVLRRVRPMLPFDQLTPAFAWDASTRIAKLKPRRDVLLEESLLRQALTDSGYIRLRAAVRLAEMGTKGELQLKEAQEILRPWLKLPETDELRPRVLELAQMLDLEVAPRAKRTTVSVPVRVPPGPMTRFDVVVTSVTRDGLHVQFANGAPLVVPFERIDAMSWSVERIDDRPVLKVDLAVRRADEPVATKALRLSSADPGVALLYPMLTAAAAWRTFLSNLERVCTASFDPPLAELISPRPSVTEEMVSDVIELVTSGQSPMPSA